MKEPAFDTCTNVPRVSPYTRPSPTPLPTTPMHQWEWVKDFKISANAVDPFKLKIF